MGSKRRSLLALFMLLPVMTGFSQQRPKPPRSAPQEASAVTFTDVTDQSGIGFKHAASPTSQKYLLETMGGGVGMLDYDNDGRLDLYFANGAQLADPMLKGAMPDKRDSRFWNRL